MKAVKDAWIEEQYIKIDKKMTPSMGKTTYSIQKTITETSLLFVLSRTIFMFLACLSSTCTC
ncbi:hypothetical protein DPMN_098338 [Dreissena polymorpha]|uniref:Uncharacterized protein n=1 Tax=Dreissena polymorpha TaxID=45954 RepID=A0A9D4LDF0_DREPO|nr:hypothetical protein DPMN_098338 [Dreissena polymorpha]